MTKAIETIDLSFYDNPKTRTGFPGIKPGSSEGGLLTEFKIGHRYQLRTDLAFDEYNEILMPLYNKLHIEGLNRFKELGYDTATLDTVEFYVSDEPDHEENYLTIEIGNCSFYCYYGVDIIGEIWLETDNFIKESSGDFVFNDNINTTAIAEFVFEGMPETVEHTYELSEIAPFFEEVE